MISAALSAQILDFDLECPIVYPRTYILENNIQSISFVQSGDNIRKEVKKHRNAVTTYYFDSTGLAYMKVLDDKGTYIDTFMMNGMRCQFKTDPDSRFYEPNVYCNDKGMVIANQTEKSNYFYHFDSLDRISSADRQGRRERIQRYYFQISVRQPRQNGYHHRKRRQPEV